MSTRSHFAFLMTAVVFAAALAVLATSTVALPTVSAAATATPESTHELENFPLHQVFNGIRLVRDAIKNLLSEGQRPPTPVFELGQRAVCTMYSFYLQFSASLHNIPPDNAMYGNYSSNKLVVWSVMQSACQWVQAKAGGATPLGNCTLSEISNMCLNFDLYQMVLGLLRDVDSYISDQRFVIPESANDWINTNLNGDSESVPKSAVDLILEMYGCSLTSSGSYTCTED